MEIRNATMDDLQAIAAVEAACFPAAEAATAEKNLPGGWHTMPVISGCCLSRGSWWPLWTAFAPTHPT